MQTFFLLICCMFSAVTVQAAQTCKPDYIPASTPDSQLIDNGDGTVTDIKTGLMWKKCLEGVGGALCGTGSPSSFTWQTALEQPNVVNSGSGFAGYHDWRLPNIKELLSLVEEQCFYPAINLNRFPNTTDVSVVWSGSPYASDSNLAWLVLFNYGYSLDGNRNDSINARLVRGGN